MRRNLAAILIGIAMFKAEQPKVRALMHVPSSNKIKSKQKAKPKNKSSIKYKSTKPIKSKAVSQFRNKSNI